MLHVHIVLGKWFEIGFEYGFNWLTFGGWIHKLSFETCYTLNLVLFSRIWAQEVEFGVVEYLGWAWEANLEIPDLASSLERRIPRSSEHLCPGLRSSDHRATIARKITASSIFTVSTDRSSEGFLARAKPLILDFCSSEESLARARLLFSAKFAKCFLSVFLHPHPILGILRPSLRHLDEDIVVEHTKAN